MLQFVCLLFLLPIASALKFDLFASPGHSSKNERCIRNFVNRDTLVVVTATVGGSKGDGQVVNMHVCPYKDPFRKGTRALSTDTTGLQIKDAVGNDYGRPKDVVGETRMAFTSLADTAFDVCFENTLTGRRACYFAPIVLESTLTICRIILQPTLPSC
jgi:hypothetical protein